MDFKKFYEFFYLYIRARSGLRFCIKNWLKLTRFGVLNFTFFWIFFGLKFLNFWISLKTFRCQVFHSYHPNHSHDIKTFIHTWWLTSFSLHIVKVEVRKRIEREFHSRGDQKTPNENDDKKKLLIWWRKIRTAIRNGHLRDY